VDHLVERANSLRVRFLIVFINYRPAPQYIINGNNAATPQ